NQSKRGFDRAYGGTQTEQARELWTYNPMNFARLAEDMGALGIRVERASDIAPALARARCQPSGGDRHRQRHRCAGAARGFIVRPKDDNAHGTERFHCYNIAAGSAEFRPNSAARSIQKPSSESAICENMLAFMRGIRPPNVDRAQRSHPAAQADDGG